MTHFVLRRGWICRKQGFHRKHHSRRAEAALHRSMVNECLLHRVERLSRAEPFDGDHAAAFHVRGKGRATRGRQPIDKDGAGAAGPQVARALRAAQAELFAQHIHQQLAWLDPGAGRLTIQGECKVDGFRALAFVVVVLVVALADGVGRIEASWSERSASRGERIGVVLLGGLLVAGLVTSRAGIIRMVPEPFLPESIRGSEELIRPDERYGFLVGRVGPTDVVVGSRLADTRGIPALAGRTLTLSVARPFVADADERRQAQREFLDPATSRERRGELQRRYRVRFVLLQAHDDRDRRLVGKLQRAGASVAYRNAEFVLVELPVPS